MNNKQPNNEQLQRSSKYYSEEGFWDKVAKVAKTAGLKAIYMALRLFNTAMASSTPAAARALIFGSLGYFILPIDLVPDLIPGVGYTDDIAALGTAIGLVAQYITPEIDNDSKQQLHKWFGDYNEKDLD